MMLPTWRKGSFLPMLMIPSSQRRPILCQSDALQHFIRRFWMWQDINLPPINISKKLKQKYMKKLSISMTVKIRSKLIWIPDKKESAVKKYSGSTQPKNNCLTNLLAAPLDTQEKERWQIYHLTQFLEEPPWLLLTAQKQRLTSKSSQKKVHNLRFKPRLAR